MGKSKYTDYVPRWAAEESERRSVLDETPNIGIEPRYAPRLPTRLVPFGNESRVSAITLIDTVQITQKILTYSAQEAAFGVQFEFSDLRSVDSSVAELAKLRIEPFEEGSFIIPASLEERTIEVGDSASSDRRPVSSRDVLDRFVAIMEGVPKSPDFVSCIGVVNAVEELGRVIRREASAIEYYPCGLSSHSQSAYRVAVDAPYVERVAENRKRRLDMQYRPDSISGRLIAVDLRNATLRLELDDGREVRGTFERTASDAVTSALNKNVELHGVVGRRNKQVSSIRAIICEIHDS